MSAHYPLWVLEATEKWRSLLIPSWTVKLMPNAYDAETEKENAGEAQADAEYRRLRIWVDLGPADKPREVRAVEETIVHEILHAPFYVVGECWAPALATLPLPERTHIHRGVKHAQEGIIENLARVLVAIDRGEQLTYITEGNPGHFTEAST